MRTHFILNTPFKYFGHRLGLFDHSFRTWPIRSQACSSLHPERYRYKFYRYLK